jgi:hypothetical protein
MRSSLLCRFASVSLVRAIRPAQRRCLCRSVSFGIRFSVMYRGADFALLRNEEPAHSYRLRSTICAVVAARGPVSAAVMRMRETP